MRAVTLLKQVSANASESATEDQASDHSHQTHTKRQEFDLNITEDAPTADQLQTILEYVGQSKISSVVPGTSSLKEALKKFNESPNNFQRPVVGLPHQRHDVLCQTDMNSRLWTGTMERPLLAARSPRYSSC